MKRDGIGIWQAMMMIILVSGMMIVVMKYASISAKRVGDTYVREQTQLYLDSVIEQTLLAISDQNRSNGGCLSSFNHNFLKRGTQYSAHVDITRYYLLIGSPDIAYCGALSIPIESEETHGMVMLHVEVNATIDSELRVRILKRTLQRP